MPADTLIEVAAGEFKRLPERDGNPERADIDLLLAAISRSI